MVYMLFDNPADKQNMTFLNGYETAKIRQVYPPQKCNSTKEILAACKDMIKQSAEGDTIICWYDFMAVLCWWLCKVQFKNRKIIALNILLKDKATAKNKLAKFLYKPMLKSRKVQATVTSKKYGEHLNEMLGIHKRYTLLHDTYHGGYSIKYKGEVVPNSVFCGGRNGRDWEFLIRIAQAMPEITFNCVMPRDRFEEYQENFGKNMVVKSDIPEQEFLEFMCQSQLVATPLDTEAPAGLIAFYQAGANGKMVITSNTVTTQEYFADGRGALCGKYIEDWKNKIQYYLQHREEADVSAAKFKSFLESECSEEKYAKTLWGDDCEMKERYEGIDGLKAYAILGIALMHILSNGNFGLNGFVFQQLIPSFTNLVFLFMMVSGFGMCCGYYQKFKNQKIGVGEFYTRRYSKIWPYFALLCVLDFVMSPSKSALYEVFANLTLCQGLLPNMNISVIGVSWTLAVIFLFYLLFPFFCFLLENKKRAWLAFSCAVIYNFVCSIYFFDESHIADGAAVNFSARTNILYCAVYFIAGGLIFLYRKELAEFAAKYKVFAGAILLIATVAYFAVGSNTLTMLFFCVAALIYTLGCRMWGVLVNPVAKFLGGISFEIYLCHMVIYRVLEKLHIIHLFGNGLLAYIFTAVAVICGSVAFSVCAKWFLNKVKTFLKERVRRVNYV